MRGAPWTHRNPCIGPIRALLGKTDSIEDSLVGAIPPRLKTVNHATRKDCPVPVELSEPVQSVGVEVSGLKILWLIASVILSDPNILSHGLAGRQTDTHGSLNVDRRLGGQRS